MILHQTNKTLLQTVVLSPLRKREVKKFSEEGKKMLNTVVTTGPLPQPMSAQSHADVCGSRGNEGWRRGKVSRMISVAVPHQSVCRGWDSLSQIEILKGSKVL